MDKHREDPKDIGAKAKAEKYAKILAKTIINPEGDALTVARVPTSTTRQRACWHRRFCCWLNSYLLLPD